MIESIQTHTLTLNAAKNDYGPVKMAQNDFLIMYF